MLPFPNCGRFEFKRWDSLQAMSLLLDLADDISVSILGRWIDLRAVSCLDSAVCATVLRDQLLNLIRAPALEFTSFPPSSSWTTEFLRWCVQRLVKVQNMDIILQGEDAQLLTARLLAICGANLVKCDLRGPVSLRSAGEHWIVRCASAGATKAVAFQLHEMSVSVSTLLGILRPERPLQILGCRGCQLLCDEPIALQTSCTSLVKLGRSIRSCGLGPDFYPQPVPESYMGQFR
jgi:hypothetical protein